MKTIIDPTNNCSNKTLSYLGDLLGILPDWVRSCPESEDLVPYLSECYGFGALLGMEGGVIKEDGVYTYPDDPDLYPLISMEREQETVFIYYYGIVGIVYKDVRSAFVTRMD